MNAQTHSIGNGARVGDSTVRRQLDMLAAGQMDQATFLRATIARLREDPDENWEVLSLLDQYFRLNKIPGETFRAVKNGLAEFVLRPRGSAPAQTQEPPPTIQITPRPFAQSAATATVQMPQAPLAQQTFVERATPSMREVPVPPRAAPMPPAQPSAPPPASNNIVLETPAIVDRDLAAGDVLRGRYRIQNFVGQGGRGMVYAATDPYRLDSSPQGQRVAIKLLQRSLAKRPDAVLELRREFQLLQSLTHPNIVRVHEFDRDGALSFFTMELLNGVLLTRVAQARRQRPLSRAHALAIIRDIGGAMSFAHAKGVVHGDINPQNIFVTFDGDVRVLDFGAARHARRDSPFIAEDDGRGSFATIGYASPQVMGGQHAEIQDDIFSLACVAYLLLGGRHPFNEVSSLQAQASRTKPKRLSGLKDGPWRALRQALHYDRSKRPPSVAEFLAKLDLSQAAVQLPSLNDLLESQGTSRARIPWGAIAAGVLLLGGAAFAYMVREDMISLPGSGAAHESVATALAPAAGETDEFASRETVPPTSAASTHAANNSAPAPVAAAVSASPASASPHAAATPPAAAPRADGAGLTMTRTAPVAAAPVETAAAVPVARTMPTPAPVTTAAPRPEAAAPAATAVPAPGAAPRIATTARVELVADTVDVTGEDAVARIVVHRKGTLRGEAPFSWWTESGTAKPGTDFEPASAHVASIPDGAASATLTIPLVQTLRSQPKSFYVVIDQTEGGAMVTGRTLTMVTLPGSSGE